MRYFIYCAVALTVCSSMSLASAQDKVVVIPLNTSTSIPVGIPTVTSAGQVWMDRNLGALRVATKIDDSDAYGTLWQWGRSGDGHEYRSSSTTTVLSSSYSVGHGSFILNSSFPYNWMNSLNNTLWQGESGINNPCPEGFRLPTEAEWEVELSSWSSQSAAGAFASPLKLVLAGDRSVNYGLLWDTAAIGMYWSSTVNGNYIRVFNFISWSAGIGNYYRGSGFSVRCIKD